MRERRRSTWALRRFFTRPLPVGALIVVIALVVLAELQHTVAHYSWEAIDLRPDALSRGPTTWEHHFFGTDVIGRDVFSRTVFGLHTTIEIGFAAAGIALAIGIPVGVAAGYYGGWFDTLVTGLTDLITAFPAVMLSLAAIVFFRPVWPHTLIVVLGLYLWTTVARAVRSHAKSLRANEFIDAAHALGASNLRIARSHLLPSLTGTVLVAATSVLGQAILLDATIEFFQYGLPASRSPSLGNLLAEATFSGGLGIFGYRQLGWWVWTFPAIVLSLLLTCINIVGDELDAALNPTAVVAPSRRRKPLARAARLARWLTAAE